MYQRELCMPTASTAGAGQQRCRVSKGSFTWPVLAPLVWSSHHCWNPYSNMDNRGHSAGESVLPVQEAALLAAFP